MKYLISPKLRPDRGPQLLCCCSCRYATLRCGCCCQSLNGLRASLDVVLRNPSTHLVHPSTSFPFANHQPISTIDQRRHSAIDFPQSNVVRGSTGGHFRLTTGETSFRLNLINSTTLLPTRPWFSTTTTNFVPSTFCSPFPSQARAQTGRTNQSFNSQLPSS